jgi:hypothetical protein
MYSVFQKSPTYYWYTEFIWVDEKEKTTTYDRWSKMAAVALLSRYQLKKFVPSSGAVDKKSLSGGPATN